jgi:hypothetical protein
MQRTYQDAASHQGGDNAMIGTLKVTFERGIIQQLSLKVFIINFKAVIYSKYISQIVDCCRSEKKDSWSSAFWLLCTL